MSHLKSLSIYAFTIFFNAAISFVTFSLLTHYLSKEDYGIINLYSSFCILIVPFVGIGIQFILSVDYFKMDSKGYRMHFASGLMIPLIMTAFLSVLFIPFFYPLKHLLKLTPFFIVTIPLSCFLLVINDVILSLIRNKAKHFLYAGFSIAKNLIESGLAILLVIFLSYNWQGRLGANFVSLLVSGFFVFFLLKKWNLISRHIEMKQVREITRNGLPFVPERLAIFVMAYSDRFFIDYYKGTGDVGLYSAGAQIAVIVNLIILTLNNTFYPVIYQQLSQQPVDYRGVKKTTFLFISITFFVMLILILVIPWIFKLFVGHEFQDGQVYAKYLSIGFFFWSIYAVFVAYLLYLKKNRIIMYISMIGMITSLTLNYFNVKHFGAMGAVYTNIIVYFIMGAITVYFANKYYGLKNVFGMP